MISVDTIVSVKFEKPIVMILKFQIYHPYAGVGISAEKPFRQLGTSIGKQYQS